MNLKAFLQYFGLLAIFLSLVPIVAVDFWWIRIFDYPHLQLTALTLVALIVYFVRFEIRRWQDYLFVVLLAACFVFQFTKVYPYFPFSTPAVAASDHPGAKSFKILSANVLQKNTRYDSVLNLVNRKDPDILLLMETDQKWADAMKPLDQRYPFRLKAPLPNTYGLLFYSKFPLIDPEIKYLVDDSIPSVHALFALPGPRPDTIQLFAIHPTPPMPQHNPSSSDRDTEMMMVAQMSRKAARPVLVVGDFNDVPWANTTQLFKNGAMLLDPREGRSVYNSFDANNLMMRWPLDHLFVSEHFRIKEFTELWKIGSDHFPLYAELSFVPLAKIEQTPQHPSVEQLKEINRQLDSTGQKE